MNIRKDVKRTNHSSAIRITAAVLTLIVLFVMSYFMIFESTHMVHECTGNDCQVCHELKIAESMTKQLLPEVIMAEVCFLLTVFAKDAGTVIKSSLSERNLILDKVRIDD